MGQNFGHASDRFGMKNATF